MAIVRQKRVYMLSVFFWGHLKDPGFSDYPATEIRIEDGCLSFRSPDRKGKSLIPLVNIKAFDVREI
jgi:hypothetical protein